MPYRKPNFYEKSTFSKVNLQLGMGFEFAIRSDRVVKADRGWKERPAYRPIFPNSPDSRAFGCSADPGKVGPNNSSPFIVNAWSVRPPQWGIGRWVSYELVLIAPAGEGATIWHS